MYLLAYIKHKEPYLSIKDIFHQSTHREARPLTERPGLQKEGKASYREAGPLIGQPDLPVRGL